MASTVLKVHKVAEPIVRSVEIRELYDQSLNELEETWNDLSKLKSTFRNIGYRIDGVTDQRFAMRESSKHTAASKARLPRQPIRSLVHPQPRKVCRLDDRYKGGEGVDRESLSFHQPGKHVEFVTPRSCDDIMQDKSPGDTGSSLTVDVTDSRAERDTQVRFLNTEVSLAQRAGTNTPAAEVEPDMTAWVRRVNVQVPKAVPFAKATKGVTGGSTATARALFGTGDAWKRGPMLKDVPDGEISKLKDMISKQRAKSADKATYNGAREQPVDPEAKQVDPQRGERSPAFSLPDRCTKTERGSHEVKARKVASLPASKAYPGFNRPQQAAPASSKLEKVTGVKQLPGAAKGKQAWGASSPRQRTAEADAKPGKQLPSTSVVATVKRNAITPSSWREGIRIVRQELGPAVGNVPPASSLGELSKRAGQGRPKSSSPRPSSAPAAGRKTEALQQDAGRKRATQALSELPARAVARGKEAADEVLNRLAEDAAAGAIVLSETAREVLQDLHGNTEPDRASTPARASTRRPEGRLGERRRAARLPSAADRKETERAVQAPVSQKVRRYEAVDIQKYMQKKKADEKRQRAAEAAAKKKAEDEHRRKLQDLLRKQKRGCKARSSVKPRPQLPGRAPTQNDSSMKAHNDTFTQDECPPFHQAGAVESDKENHSACSSSQTSGSEPSSSGAMPDEERPVLQAVEGGQASGHASSGAAAVPSEPAAGHPASDELLDFADDNLKRILEKYKSRQPDGGPIDKPPVSQPPQSFSSASLAKPDVSGGQDDASALFLKARLGTPARSSADRIAIIKAASSMLAAKLHSTHMAIADHPVCAAAPGHWLSSATSATEKLSVLPTQSSSLRLDTQSLNRKYEDLRRQQHAAEADSGSTDTGSTGEAVPFKGYGTAGLRDIAFGVTSLEDSDVTSDDTSTAPEGSPASHIVGTKTSRETDTSAQSSSDESAILPTPSNSSNVAERILGALKQTDFCASSRDGSSGTLPPFTDQLRLSLLTDTPMWMRPEKQRYEGADTDRQAGPVKPRTGYLGLAMPDFHSSINTYMRKEGISRPGATSSRPAVGLEQEAQPVSSVRSNGSLVDVQVADAAVTCVRGTSVRFDLGASTVQSLQQRPESDTLGMQSLQTLVRTKTEAPFYTLNMGNDAPRERQSGNDEAKCTSLGNNALGAARQGRSPARSREDSTQGSESDLSEPGVHTKPHTPEAAKQIASVVLPNDASVTAKRKVEEVTASERTQAGQRFAATRTFDRPEVSCMSPGSLGFRMAAELNLLDGVEESVRALNDVEMSRHAVAAQQEAATFELLLQSRKQAHEHELRQLRARVRAEEEEAQRQLEAVRQHAVVAERERDAAAENLRRSESHSVALYNSTKQLVESQAEAIRTSVEATKSLVEYAAAASRQEPARWEEAVQVAAEAAATSRMAALTALMDRGRQEQVDFLRMARQHVYDRSTQVSTSLKPADDSAAVGYGSSFDSPSLRTATSSLAHSKNVAGNILPALARPALSSADESTPLSTPGASYSDTSIAESDRLLSASASTASVISSEPGRGRRKKTGKDKVSASSIGTESELYADSDRPSNSPRADLSASPGGGGSIKTLSDVQAIVHRQATGSTAKMAAVLTTASASSITDSSPKTETVQSNSALTTEALGQWDRETAKKNSSMQEVPTDEKNVHKSLDDGTASEGSTIRSGSGIYESGKLASGKEDEYTQDFDDTSLASADESGADTSPGESRQKTTTMYSGGGTELAKQKPSPRAGRSAAKSEDVVTTSADDTGRFHGSHVPGVHIGSASRELSAVRQQIRDDKLRWEYEKQMARAKYRAISYKSKYELQTLETQKEIARSKCEDAVVAELELRAAALVESCARKKATIQSKFKSARSYYTTRLKSLYAELAAAAQDLGGAVVPLAQFNTALDAADVSLSETSISSSAEEFAVPTVAMEQLGTSTAGVTVPPPPAAARVPGSFSKLKRGAKDWQGGHNASEPLSDGKSHRGTVPTLSYGEGGTSNERLPVRDGLSAKLQHSSAVSEESGASEPLVGQPMRPTATSDASKLLLAGSVTSRASRRKLLEQQLPLGRGPRTHSSRLSAHADSESDESVSASLIEGGTGSESDTEGRIQALTYELRRKQKVEAQLKRTRMDTERELKRSRETALRNQIKLTEENIARLSENLLTVRSTAQQQLLSESSSGDGGSQQQLSSAAQHVGVAALCDSGPGPAAAAVTKPQIKQPRAAHQQLSPAVAATSAAKAVTVQLVSASSPDRVLSPEANEGSTPRQTFPFSPDVSPRVLSEALADTVSEDDKIQALQMNSAFTVAPHGSGDVHSLERPQPHASGQSAKLEFSTNDRGDNVTSKGYTSDSFVDSYTSDEPFDNDDGKSESVPEEIREVLDQNTSAESHAASDIEDNVVTGPLSHGTAATVHDEDKARPASSVTASIDSAKLPCLHESGEASVTDTADSTRRRYSDYKLTPHSYATSESSTIEDDTGALPLAVPLTLQQHAVDIQVTPVLPTVASVTSLSTPQQAPVTDNFETPDQPTPRSHLQSPQSSITEEDIPYSLSQSSDSVKDGAPIINHSVPCAAAAAMQDGNTDGAKSAVLLPTDVPLSPQTFENDDEVAAISESLPRHSDSISDHVSMQGSEANSEEHCGRDVNDSDYNAEVFESEASTTSSVTHSKRSAGQDVQAPVDFLPFVGDMDGRIVSGNVDFAEPLQAVASVLPVVVNTSASPRHSHSPPSDNAGNNNSEDDASWSASDGGKRHGNNGPDLGGHLYERKTVINSDEAVSECIEEDVESSGDEASSDRCLLADIALPDVISVEPEVTAAVSPDAASAKTDTVAIDKIADWLLTDALESYRRAKAAKQQAAALAAARESEVSATASVAPLPKALEESQQPLNATMVVEAAMTRGAAEKLQHLSPANNQTSERKLQRDGREPVPQSQSMLSLADLPPLTGKKAPAAQESFIAVEAKMSSPPPVATSTPAEAHTISKPMAAAEPKLSRPLSPILGSSAAGGTAASPDDAWTKLDKEINSVFGEDIDWFDEDFGLGISKKPSAAIPNAAQDNLAGAGVPVKPPPPYPGVSDASKPAGKVDVKTVAQAAFSVIPEKRADVLAIAFRAVDIFWQMRRFGESWTGAQPPEEFMAEVPAGSLEGDSIASHRRMLFELVGEMVRDIYKDEAEAEGQELWHAARRSKPSRRYWKGKTPPATVDELKKVVEGNLFKIIGCPTVIKSAVVGPRARKRDRVDMVLVEELRQEEADWVDYNADEATVKEAIVQDIFNILILDAGKAISEAMHKTGRYLE